MSRSNYRVEESNETTLVIRDLGPWNHYKTVTNDADNVVAELHAAGKLGNRRLFYYDSDGRRDELVHDGNGVFLTFAPGEQQ